jgi:hypothetical protein
MLRTPFWKAAAASLPAHVRGRYLREFERAERWELAFDAALKTLSRLKGVRALSHAHQ